MNEQEPREQSGLGQGVQSFNQKPVNALVNKQINRVGKHKQNIAVEECEFTDGPPNPKLHKIKDKFPGHYLYVRGAQGAILAFPTKELKKIRKRQAFYKKVRAKLWAALKTLNFIRFQKKSKNKENQKKQQSKT